MLLQLIMLFLQLVSLLIITCDADLFTTTFSPYLLRFFTVNYALRLNLIILRLNKHRFFKIRLYRKGHTVIDHSERHNF
jgi:hypothetical protein